MTAVTATSPVRRSLVRPTPSERVLLRLSVALETAAIARMERRARAHTRTPETPTRTLSAAADRRRDAAATVHSGLLPR